MSNVNNVMIVGVGGQGTLLASRILGNMMMNQEFDVKVSEVHGMSQRGGSVVTYVRYGEQVYSPIIEQGEADIILAFEECEAARWVPYLKTDGTIIVNTQRIDPMPVITGAAAYPERIIESISELGFNIIALDALALARQAGTPKAVNVVLIGALSAILPFDDALWEEAVKNASPLKFLEENLKAFRLGRAHREN